MGIAGDAVKPLDAARRKSPGSAMSVSAAETNTDALGSQAETMEVEAGAAAPRRGGRVRKPTSKAAGLDVTEAAEVSASRTGKKRKAEDVVEEINDEIKDVFDDGNDQGGDVDGEDDDDDDKVYCICRGKDDGTFMISCERCQEWLVQYSLIYGQYLGRCG